MSEEKRLSCSITAPDTTKTYEGLRSVSIPSATGTMQILPGHAESFVLIGDGDVILKSADGHIEILHIGQSECHIHHDQVMIIA